MKAKSKAAKKKAKQAKEKSGMVIISVENPNFDFRHSEHLGNPRHVSAAYNPRESPVAWMHSKNYVDAAQARAAGRFRQLYERAGGSSVKAMDYTKDPVDGGSVSDGLTDAKMDAAKRLGQIRDKLGPAGYELVEKVCGELQWLKDIEPTRRRRDVISVQLKACLTAMADFWGYKTREVRSWRHTG